MGTKLNLHEKRVTRLTGNERTVLRFLLRNGRISDVEIGEKLKITSQAVSKIRRKLKEMGIIKDYCIELDHSSLGINTFALVMLEISPIGIVEEINKLMSGNLIGFYKICKNDITHIALFAFRNLDELDEYFNSLHFEHSEYVKIRNIYVFPINGLLKHSSSKLFCSILNEFGKENMPMPPILTYHLKEKSKNNVVKLSTNEKNILKSLIKDCRTSYARITSGLNNLSITGGGVRKIVMRLENKGVINGFSVNLSYEKLGISIFAFIFLKKQSNYWKLKDGLCKLADKSYNVIGCYRLNEDCLHVLFCGFRSLEELENYYHQLQFKNKGLLEIDKIYLASNSGIMRNSPLDLFHTVLR